MPELYFSKFPTIEYANSKCVDITKRIVASPDLRRSPVVYDEYELKSSTRADIISENYYKDPNMEWLLWLVNGIVDPYYGWHLSSSDFDKYIESKYGSLEIAQKKISHYQINWKYDDTKVSPSFYNNTMADNSKKYFSPVYNEGVTIIEYVRKQDDSIVNTNKIYDFELSNNTIEFTVGEVVDIKTVLPSAVVGGGEVVFANSTNIKIKNISGDMASNNLVIGETSGATATIKKSTLLIENITDEEAIYWEPVSYYDKEYDINEKNRNIKLMNPVYASEMAYNMRTIFKK